mmetsp:Transcript_6774/g.13543  ORF Transcript_6774/g.13543 Transcript_6774/m.13543 type:complete len:201 (+) Transcript_6774:350-952(+)
MGEPIMDSPRTAARPRRHLRGHSGRQLCGVRARAQRTRLTRCRWVAASWPTLPSFGPRRPPASTRSISRRSSAGRRTAGGGPGRTALTAIGTRRRLSIQTEPCTYSRTQSNSASSTARPFSRRTRGADPIASWRAIATRGGAARPRTPRTRSCGSTSEETGTSLWKATPCPVATPGAPTAFGGPTSAAPTASLPVRAASI